MEKMLTEPKAASRRGQYRIKQSLSPRQPAHCALCLLVT